MDGQVRKRKVTTTFESVVKLATFIRDHSADGKPLNLATVIEHAARSGIKTTPDAIDRIAKSCGVELVRRGRGGSLPGQRASVRELAGVVRLLFERMGEPVPPALEAICNGKPPNDAKGA